MTAMPPISAALMHAPSAAPATTDAGTPVQNFIGRLRGVKPRVAVVGGSIGGLVAALKLQEDGYDVTVYEASSRLGGKMMTGRDAQTGHQIEIGAELVDASHTQLVTLCKDLGVELVDRQKEMLARAAQGGQGETELIYDIGGVRRTAKDFIDPATGKGAFEALRTQIAKDLAEARDPATGAFTAKGVALDALSIDAYLEQHKDLAPDWVRVALKQAYAGEVGNDPDKLSALTLIDFIGTKPGEFVLYDSDEQYRVAGGMTAIIQKLTQRLQQKGVKFELNQPLVAAESLDGNRKRLLFSQPDGSTEAVDADAVVCAIPPTHLRNVQGLDALGIDDAPLTANGKSRRDIINAMQMSQSDKITLPLKGMPWQTDADGKPTAMNGEIVTDRAGQLLWVNADENGNAYLTALVAGDMVKPPAGATPEEQVAHKNKLVRTIMENYAAILGKPMDQVFDMSRIDLANDKGGVRKEWWRSGGCYGAPQQGMYTALSEFSAAPSTAPNVGIAGNWMLCADATNPGVRNKIGFVDCGVQTGQAAAEQIERALPIQRHQQQAQAAGQAR